MCTANGSRFYCACNEGWNGSTCALPLPNQPAPKFCSGSRTLTALNGTFSERTTGTQYRNNQDCRWSINPASTVGAGNAYSLDLYFHKQVTEKDYDFVTVQDAEGSAEVYTGTDMPQPVHLGSGSGVVTFSSDLGIVQSGFSASYTTRVCAGGCGNGTCVSGKCLCNYGYLGSSCERMGCPDACYSANGWGSCTTSGCACTANRGPDCSLCIPGNCTPVCDFTSITRRGRYEGPVTGSGSCKWSITPADVDTIVISFIYMPQSAIVEIADNSGNVVWSYARSANLYNNSRLPTPVVVSSSSASVTFTNSTFAGTQLLYTSFACQEQCRGHGDCLPLAYYGEQVCSCHVGWEGEFCDKPTCVGDCFGHGQCQPNYPNGSTLAYGTKCVCDPGYYGPFCSLPYCQDDQVTVLTGSKGMLQDRAEGQSTRVGSRCAWRIMPATPANVTLYFTRFALASPSDDAISIFDGPSSSSRALASFGGSYAPPAVTSSQGALYVTLTTDEVLPSVAGPLSGFQAYYIANDPACGSCGRNGYCDPVSKQCVCFSGAIGTKCNATASTANATALERDEMINDSLRLLEWKWYRLSIPSTDPAAVAHVILGRQPDNPTSENLQLRVRRGALPISDDTTELSDLTNNEEKYVVLAPPQGEWYAGVQNMDKDGNVAHYTISYLVGCPACRNGGTCSAATEYKCKCTNSYTGELCSTKITTSDSDSGAVVAGVVFLIFVIVVAAAALGFVAYKRSDQVKAYFARFTSNGFVQTDNPHPAVAQRSRADQMGDFQRL